MFQIDTQDFTEAFFRCWKAAFYHLNKQVDSGIKSWLQVNRHSPFIEHLSFRLGNQLFFVRIEDTAGKIHGPGTLNELMNKAKNSNGHACIMPMENNIADIWTAARSGWGLVDPKNNKSIDPVSLVTDENIEMTGWEVNDFAVQVVVDYMKSAGFKIISFHSTLNYDPSIWFIGNSGEPEWILVRATKFPLNRIDRPHNWIDIANHPNKKGKVGHFASVAIVSDKQPFIDIDEKPVPLFRGHGMYVNFQGLE